ncbi:MAG TPA: adenylosuccinate lyase [Methanomicrobiales archaeon]|nr:adenylosuccinate lyase [Methanomicrobiales archaeon]
MAIHPIESRYGTPEMRAVWTEEHRFTCILRAEAALAQAEARCGLIPEKDAKAIARGAQKASLGRAKEIEAEINHDMMAVVKALSEVSGDAGRWVHFGATSNDILDTATGLQLKESLALLETKLLSLLSVLLRRAGETRTLVCAARTHGQIGVPTTYGMRFALWASEIARHVDRLREMRPRVEVGKMAGAVGTMAALGKDGMAVQEKMMGELGLGIPDITNQIVPRDRYAEYIMFLAGFATTLDRMAITVRTLQRTEIAELEEPFGKKQVGSSTMPHKRNPIRSEQVSGLARVIRSAVEPALQDNTLWDERDLTNSSCERVILPEATILADHILQVMTTVMDGLTINAGNVKKNLTILDGIPMAESVMVELTKKGMGRQDAHEIVREASMEAYRKGHDLATVLAGNPAVKKLISRKALAGLLDPAKYIGTAPVQVERVIARLSKYLDRKAPAPKTPSRRR